VVDDERNVALFLQAALEHLPDCDVRAATSGEQALCFLEQDSFDLLITDYRMPGMGGVGLAARARELHPRMVIVIITAFADDALYRAIAGAGVRKVVHKPVRMGEIRALALQALGRTGDR
jgi:CheY-like chemotaxis protein